MCERDALVSHVMRLATLVRSAALKRALAAIDPHPNLNFWRIIYGNLLDIAVVEWCKIFGSDSEPGHWKKLVTDQDSFRTDMLTKLKIGPEEWAAYWMEMKRYRDTMATHGFGETDITHYPKLGLALESSYFYYSYLIGRLRALSERRYPDDLREYSERFARQAQEIARSALSATAGFTEKVW